MAFQRRRIRIPLNGLGQYMPADVPTRLLPWADPTALALARGNLSGGAPAPAVSTPQPSSPGVPGTDPSTVAAQTDALFRSYGGKALVNSDQAVYESRPPWIEAPAGARTILSQGIIPTPAASGVDQTVQTYIVPPGWDGVISEIANFYTGPGLTIAAALLAWRIERNGQAFKHFDNIQVAFGTYTTGGGLQTKVLPTPIRIFAGDVITYVVNHASGSGLPVAGTQIVTYLGGWLYPKPAGS